jgi:hypothetical protein
MSNTNVFHIVYSSNGLNKVLQMSPAIGKTGIIVYCIIAQYNKCRIQMFFMLCSIYCTMHSSDGLNKVLQMSPAIGKTGIIVYCIIAQYNNTQLHA